MSSFDEKPLFNSAPEIHSFAGVLFDMDGTIVDSTDAIVKHWHKLELSSSDLLLFSLCCTGWAKN